jgi:hypothetical protein
VAGYCAYCVRVFTGNDQSYSKKQEGKIESSLKQPLTLIQLPAENEVNIKKIFTRQRWLQSSCLWYIRKILFNLAIP